jgi:hypothetical protein
MVTLTLQLLYPSCFFDRRLSGETKVGLDMMTKTRITVEAGARTCVSRPIPSHFTELLQLAKLYEDIARAQKETTKWIVTGRMQ